jgi:hypothetical protein
MSKKKQKFVKFLDKGGVYNKICSMTYEGSALSAIHYLRSLDIGGSYAFLIRVLVFI